MEFFIETLHITNDVRHVEINTSVIDTDGDTVKGRTYCNFVITYDEYIKLKLKVGDSVTISISNLRLV